MATNARSQTDYFLSFRLGEETYAIDVGNAREIVECSTVTKIPQTPPWIRGVINLRGKVVPVIDLKHRFDMGETEYTVHTCVIVVETVIDGELFVVGILADAAKEVFELDSSTMKPPPKFGIQVDTRYIRGMTKQNGELLVVLDAQRIFSLEEFTAAQSLVSEAPDAPSSKPTENTEESIAANVDEEWAAEDSPHPEIEMTMSEGA